MVAAVCFLARLQPFHSLRHLLHSLRHLLLPSFYMNIYSQAVLHTLMDASPRYQAAKVDSASLLLEEFYRMKAKHSRPKPRLKRLSDPVNTQIYVHPFGQSRLPFDQSRHALDEGKSLPRIKDSSAFKLQSRAQNSERRHNLTEAKGRRCETIPYDVECAGRFPQNSSRQPIADDKMLKGKKFVQIDMLALRTHYARSTEATMKQRVGAEESRKGAIDIPPKEAIAAFIKSYRVKNQLIHVDELVRSSHFAVQFVEKAWLYFGEVREGEPEGNGVMVTRNWVFEGRWCKGHKHQGLEIAENGFYKGSFLRNERSQVGEFFWNNGEYYSGEWRGNKKHGTGVWKSVEGDVYMGQWNRGKVQGYGIHLSRTGQKYQGYFQNFLKNGQGKEFFPNGDFFQGTFRQGKPQGQGTYTWRNGTTYEGHFSQGLREGQGKITKEGVEYEGSFRGEKAHGEGRLTVFSGDNYRGEFRQGKKEGKGVAREGRRIYVGTWKNNHFLQNLHSPS